MSFKSIFLLVISFFLFTLCKGQSFNAELSAGLSANQIDGDNLSGYDRAGLFLGGGVGFPVSNKAEIRGDFFFIQKGSRSTDKSPFFLIWKMNYLEIPVTLKYKLGTRFYLNGGFAADILMSSKADGGSGFSDNSNGMNKINPVSVFGFGYNLSPTLSFGARHIYSLISFDKLYRRYNNTIAVYLTLKLKQEQVK